jgi:hypothetical protein
MSDRYTTLTIADTETESEEICLADHGSLMAVWIQSPSSLPATVNIRTSRTKGGTYTIQRSNLADITLASDRADQITVLGGLWLKIVAGSAVSGAKVFQVVVSALRATR